MESHFNAWTSLHTTVIRIPGGLEGQGLTKTYVLLGNINTHEMFTVCIQMRSS